VPSRPEAILIDAIDDDEGGQVFVEFIPSKKYLSPHKRCQTQYAEAADAHARTGGSHDIRMMHEYIPEAVEAERPYAEIANASGARMSARERFDLLFAALDIINERKFALSERQMIIVVDTYFVACLLKIFGDELIGNMDYIMKRINITALFQDVFVMLQRRGGKTIATSVFISCFTTTQISGNFNVFGKSQRITKMIKSLVKECYQELRQVSIFCPTSIEEDNDERFSILTLHKSVNVNNFYPANSEVCYFFFSSRVYFSFGRVISPIVLCFFLGSSDPVTFFAPSERNLSDQKTTTTVQHSLLFLALYRSRFLSRSCTQSERYYDGSFISQLHPSRLLLFLSFFKQRKKKRISFDSTVEP
jgi:hypothetical protein